MTILIVASKPSTAKFADRVIVLAGGSIVADGDHEHLVTTSSTYRELVGIDDAAA